MYFNQYDFNNNADGIRSASRHLFWQRAQGSQIEEGAMLVGMFKNSSLYNPRKNPQGVINRRNVVLAQMERITTSQPRKGFLTETPLAAELQSRRTQ